MDFQQQCEAAGVKFFFKQWGCTNKKKTGRELNGRTYDEMSLIEFPEFLEQEKLRNANRILPVPKKEGLR